MKRFTFLLILGIMIFASCRKETIQPVVDPSPTTMDQLVISKNFDWKTTKDYQFTVTGSSNHTLRIASASGTVYHKAFLVKNVPYSVNLTLPSYEKSIHLLYNGQDITCQLSKTVISYTFSK
jgi:hypothetical protein